MESLLAPDAPAASTAVEPRTPSLADATWDEAAAWSRPWLRVALAALLLAASTGVLLRFGLVRGMPAWAANYGAVRHAHSHLMYFGWGTLAIMALIWGLLPLQTGRPRPRSATWLLALTALLSLLSFPAFWANGYGRTLVLGRELPLGSMAAAVNGLPWFWFAGLYAVNTWRLPSRTLAVQLWDWALALLLLASLGALTLGMQVALDVESAALREASLHLFLDLFATGWFVLAGLGLLWALLGEPQLHSSVRRAPWLPSMALALPLAFTFVLGMSPAVVTPVAFWMAALANLAAAALLALHLRALWGERARLPLLVRVALLFLAVHVAAALVVLVPGVWRVAVGGQLRVFYLHNLLLGFLSTLLMGLALPLLRGRSFAHARSGEERFERWVALLWSVGVALLVLALLGLGLTRWLPVSSGLFLRMAAWSSLLPPLAAALALLAPAPRRNKAPAS